MRTLKKCPIYECAGEERRRDGPDLSESGARSQRRVPGDGGEKFRSEQHDDRVGGADEKSTGHGRS